MITNNQANFKLASLLLLLYFIVIDATYLYKVCFSIPYLDDWFFLNELKEYVDGTLGLSFLFSRYNGHFYLSTKVAYLLDYSLFGLDLRIMRVIILAFLVLEMIAAYILMLRAFDSRWDSRIVLLGAAGAVACTGTLAQWEVFTLSMAVTNVAALFFVILSLRFLSNYLRSRSASHLIATLILAGVATLNMAQGFLVWFAVMGATIFVDAKKNFTLIISCLTLGIILAFATIQSVQGASMYSILQDPSAVPKSIIMSSGLPFSAVHHSLPIVSLTIFSGIVCLTLCALAMFASFRLDAADRSIAIPFIGLLIYGVGSVLMIAIGRNGVGVTASRYVAVVCPLAIGLIGMLVTLSRTMPLAKPAVIAASSLALLGALISDYDQFGMAEAQAAFGSDLKQTIAKSNSFDPHELARRLYLRPRSIPYIAPALSLRRTHKDW